MVPARSYLNRRYKKKKKKKQKKKKIETEKKKKKKKKKSKQVYFLQTSIAAKHSSKADLTTYKDLTLQDINTTLIELQQSRVD